MARRVRKRECRVRLAVFKVRFSDRVGREYPELKWAFSIFAGLYVLALILFLIGTFGWFNQDKDPLSAMFLLPLGLPWNAIFDRVGFAGLPSLLLAPLVNAGILLWLWER